MIVICPHMLRGQLLKTKKISWSGYVMYKLRLPTLFNIVQPTKTVSPAGQNCDNAVYFPVTVIGWHWVINNLGKCLQSAAPTFLLNSSLRCYSYILSIMSAYFSATAFLFTLSVGPRRLSKGFIIWWALWKMNNNSVDQYRSIIDQIQMYHIIPLWFHCFQTPFRFFAISLLFILCFGVASVAATSRSKSWIKSKSASFFVSLIYHKALIKHT